MANKHFVVHNGLTVGSLSVDAETGNLITQGNITTDSLLVSNNIESLGNISAVNLEVSGDLDVTGNITITGDLGVSQISKNDSSISINDTGTGSSVVIAIDGATETTVDAAGLKLPSNNEFYINDQSVLNATTLGNGVVNSNLTSVGTLDTLSVTGNVTATNLTGTLLTASQTNITAVGTLGTLSVTGNVDSGNVSATNLTGTLLTASQTNITAVGNLTTLSASGTIRTVGQLFANSNVATSSTATGAVVVAGGVGISGGLQTGADIFIAGKAAATVDDATALSIALGG